jgi:hypothetical protein
VTAAIGTQLSETYTITRKIDPCPNATLIPNPSPPVAMVIPTGDNQRVQQINPWTVETIMNSNDLFCGPKKYEIIEE